MDEKEIEKKKETEVDPCAGENWHPVQAWLVVVALFVFYLVGIGSLNMLNPILKLMLEEFSADTVMGSNFNSALTLSCAVISFPFAWAMNKYGFRAIGIISLIIGVATAAWGAICDNAWIMVVIRVIQGVFYTAPGVIGVYLITQWFPKDKQSIPIALFAIAPNLARVVVNQMSKPAIALGGWRMQWWFLCIGCVVALVLFVIFCRPGPGYAVAEAERRAREEKKASQEKAPLSVVLKNPSIWAVVLLMAMFSLSSRGFDTFTNMILTENCGVSNDTASDITSLFSFAKMWSGPLIGVIMAKCIHSRGKIIACMLSIFFVGMIFGYTLNSPMAAWIFVLVVGTVGSVFTLCLTAMPLFCESPAVLAMALTFLNFLGKYVSGFIAPYIVSGVKDATGVFYYTAIPCAVFAVIGIVCAWYVGVKLDKDTKAKEVAAA